METVATSYRTDRISIITLTIRYIYTTYCVSRMLVVGRRNEFYEACDSRGENFQ